MKDLLGQDIGIGDILLYSYHSRTSIRHKLVHVCSFTERMIRVIPHKKANPTSEDMQLVTRSNVLVVTKNLEALLEKARKEGQLKDDPELVYYGL